MVFAGRERDIADLRAALGGGSRLVLVTGDAGIGKTVAHHRDLEVEAAEGVHFERVA